MTSLPKLCLVVDVRDWAFDRIAARIADRMQKDCLIDIVYLSDYPEEPELFFRVFGQQHPYDLIHFFWRDTLFRLFTSKDFLISLNQSSQDKRIQILEQIAASKKTTWVCDHLFLDSAHSSVLRKWSLNLSDEFAVSSSILFDIYAKLDAYRHRPRIISDGVDLNIFKTSNTAKSPLSDNVVKIGWAGNSGWGKDALDHKGLTTVIKPAIEKLKSEGHAVEGVFCDRREKWTPQSEMPRYYGSIDIYVCASIHEGTPNPILEAMACGVPIMSTNVGIVKDALGPEQQSYIVSDRQSPEFYEKLKTLVARPDIRQMLSIENKNQIKNWDWQIQIEAWRNFFLDMLKTEKHAGLQEQQMDMLLRALKNSQYMEHVASPTVNTKSDHIR